MCFSATNERKRTRSCTTSDNKPLFFLFVFGMQPMTTKMTLWHHEMAGKWKLNTVNDKGYVSPWFELLG